MLDNPLLLPLLCAILLLVALLSAGLALAIRGFLDAEALRRALLNMLPRPDTGVERSYLKAIEQALGKTPALLAASEAKDLTLFEAFSPLTLGPDQDEVAAPDVGRQSGAELDPRIREALGEHRSSTSSPRSTYEQSAYWSLWALAEIIPLSILIAVTFWLIGPVAGTWRLDWWRIALVIALAVGWFLLAHWLHGWLVADDHVLDGLLAWWHRRSQCLAAEGTPGAEIWANPRLLIRGHPGCGKTTLLRHIAAACARERQGKGRKKGEPRVRDLYGWPGCPFPIYIPLRALDLGRDQVDLLGCYSQKLSRLIGLSADACDSRFFSQRLAAGGCLVLLDAFDELRDVDARAQVARLIAALPGGPRRRPNRFVVTSRIVGYEGQLDAYDYVRRRIKDLDDEQAAAFIRARYAAIAASERRGLGQDLNWGPTRQAENLIDRLPTNPGLRRLSRNPLLLSLTVALHHDHRGKGLRLPEERYRLYEEALRLLVRDWDRRKEIDHGLEPTDDGSDLKLDEKLRLLRELAWMMFEQAGDAADTRAFAVTRGDFARAKLAEVLARIPGFASEKTGDARIAHARSESIRWMQNLGVRGGVLQELGNVPGSNEVEVQFAHLTFQEYLAARAAASEEGERRLGRIIDRWDRPAWREVLLLYAASQDATPIVRHLLAQPGPAGALLAGAVLLERPISLDDTLLDRTLERLRDLAFVRADAGEADALEALRQLEERAALPERPALLGAMSSAPHPAVRARLIALLPKLDLSPSELQSTLLSLLDHEQDYRPRLAAGAAIAPHDPRFQGAGWLPELVEVPAEPFVMGEGEHEHRLDLPTYGIGRYPVTVAQWRVFAESGAYEQPAYWTSDGWSYVSGEIGEYIYIYQPERHQPKRRRWSPSRRTPAVRPRQPARWKDPGPAENNLPVVNITWHEAVAYCRWLSAQTGADYHLPSEAQWEKAARGRHGLIYPWGNAWEPGRCNSKELGLGHSSPVGSFPAGASPYGAEEMAGNVWEWCATKRGKAYPYDVHEDEWDESYLEGEDARRVRGGAFWNDQHLTRGSCRNGFLHPRDRVLDRGLRVASRSPRPLADSAAARPKIHRPGPRQ